MTRGKKRTRGTGNLAADSGGGSVQPLGCGLWKLWEKDSSTPRSIDRLHPPPWLGVKQA
jgi:hypothetical protein